MLAKAYVLIAIGVIALAAVGGAYYRGRVDGENACIAKQAKEEEIRAETRRIALEAAGEKIAAIQVKHTTINRKVESVTREIPVYRDCLNDERVRGLLDAAREGGESAPGDPGSVPTAR